MFDINAIINTAISSAVNEALAPIQGAITSLTNIIKRQDQQIEELQQHIATLNNMNTDTSYALVKRVEQLEAQQITVPISSSVANMPDVPITEYVKTMDERISKLTNEVEQLQERSALDWDYIKDEHILPAIRGYFNDIDLSDTIREQVEELDLAQKMRDALEDVVSDEVESQLGNLDLDSQIDWDDKVRDALNDIDLSEYIDVTDAIDDALNAKDYVETEELSDMLRAEVREMLSAARLTF